MRQPRRRAASARRRRARDARRAGRHARSRARTSSTSDRARAGRRSSSRSTSSSATRACSRSGRSASSPSARFAAGIMTIPALSSRRAARAVPVPRDHAIGTSRRCCWRWASAAGSPCSPAPPRCASPGSPPASRRSPCSRSRTTSSASGTKIGPGAKTLSLIFVHSRRMLWVISSTAKVAMPAASPQSRISGRPSTSASTPPSSAASTSEGTCRACGRAGSEELGQHARLRLHRDRHHARGEPADRDEADLPEREHARVADEDVDRDDHRDRDQRAQEVLLVGERDLRADQPDDDDEQHRAEHLERRDAPRHTRSTTDERPRTNRPAGRSSSTRITSAITTEAGRSCCRSAGRR